MLPFPAAVAVPVDRVDDVAGDLFPAPPECKRHQRRSANSVSRRSEAVKRIPAHVSQPADSPDTPR